MKCIYEALRNWNIFVVMSGAGDKMSIEMVTYSLVNISSLLCFVRSKLNQEGCLFSTINLLNGGICTQSLVQGPIMYFI